MLAWKGYQRSALEELKTYLAAARVEGAAAAFTQRTGRPYLNASTDRALTGLPYVCLRVPTGGGKTMMACRAVGLMLEAYLQQDHGLFVWLVPSIAIREQTIARLQNPDDPYFLALQEAVGGPVTVVSLDEAFGLRRNDIDGSTCVLVSTLAALRVNDTESRRVYEANGSLTNHFASVSSDLPRNLERYEGSNIVIPSLANLIALHRPGVIMDEAHNARTPLSFETLARLSPSCVVEFTATPASVHRPSSGLFASNVLYHVSASELKAEEMIKLPISLHMHSRWEDAADAAIRLQRMLEAAAVEETGRSFRPVVLFQAQARSADRETMSAEVLKKLLIEDYRVPTDQIRLATGDTWELDGLDLGSLTCPVRYVITVQALREGWDCPSAYVLCSLTASTSTRAVEQILGRVLRMPQARRFNSPNLNKAYAVTSTRDFAQTAQSLTEALVESGFEEYEAAAFLEDNSIIEMPLFNAVSATLGESPVLERLDLQLRERVNWDSESSSLTVAGGLSADEEEAIASCFANESSRQTISRMAAQIREQVATYSRTSVAESSVVRIPWLSVRVDGQLEVFSADHFLASPWTLSRYPAELTATDFELQSESPIAGLLDIDDESGHLAVTFAREVQLQLDRLLTESDWTRELLARWIDQRTPHSDITTQDAIAFIERVIEFLVTTRHMPLADLARQKSRFQSAIERKIDTYRTERRRESYQDSLFGANPLLFEVGDSNALVLDPNRYAYSELYAGAVHFQKHLFPQVGDLREDGEEYSCALQIDLMPGVRNWLRNTTNRPSSFWLQTSTDRFYPDFVVILNNGKVLVVEYKGADRYNTPDSHEKRIVGDIWARRSNGACHFLMLNGPDWGTLRDTVNRLANS